MAALGVRVRALAEKKRAQLSHNPGDATLGAQVQLLYQLLHLVSTVPLDANVTRQISELLDSLKDERDPPLGRVNDYTYNALNQSNVGQSRVQNPPLQQYPGRVKDLEAQLRGIMYHNQNMPNADTRTAQDLNLVGLVPGS